MRAIAVIGANFGDEGKGHVTDFLVSEAPDDTVVVRHNGGAQAGHTVETPEGLRHVFHHFGSGTLLGAPTFLSRHFIVNPMAWKEELGALREIGVEPTLYVDPRCRITTPYDMLADQALQKHGSCGLGIHQTVARNANGIRFVAASQNAREVCRVIREQARGKLVSSSQPSRRLAWLEDDEILENYLTDLAELQGSVTFTQRIPEYDRVVFEGAQGLLLDEEHPNFPYVTHSQTGLSNVATLCHEHGIGEVRALYVTRSYMTRHGPGPFPTEDDRMSYPDATNVPNEFQGTLRFGDLDELALVSEIEHDLRCVDGLAVTTGLAVTCLDQHPMEFWPALVPTMIESYGPRRNDIEVTSLAAPRRAVGPLPLRESRRSKPATGGKNER